MEERSSGFFERSVVFAKISEKLRRNAEWKGQNSLALEAGNRYNQRLKVSSRAKRKLGKVITTINKATTTIGPRHWTAFVRKKPRQPPRKHPSPLPLKKRARYFGPAIGIFLTRDPLEYVDGMSVYRGYFGITWVDPSGANFQEFDEILGVTHQTDWYYPMYPFDFIGPLPIGGYYGHIANNGVLGPIQITSGDITAKVRIDADRTKGQIWNPNPKKYRTPPLFAAGVEVLATDRKAGKPCSDACGIRAWATFKRQRVAKLFVTKKGKVTVENYIPLDKFWVKDGGGSSTKTPHYDMPSRGRESFGLDENYSYSVTDYSIAIVCVCAEGQLRKPPATEVEEKAIAVLEFSVSWVLSNKNTRVDVTSNTASRLPNPGWANIWGVKSVRACPRLGK